MTTPSRSVQHDDPESDDESGGFSLPSRVKWIGGGILTAALAVLIAWFVGVRQGNAEIEALQGKLDVLEVRTNVLEGRRFLHQTVVELEARNFGSAQEKLEGASRFLSAAAPSVSDEGFATTLSQLQEFRIQVTPDVGNQIATLMQVARSIDAQLPPLPAPLTPEGNGSSSDEEAAAAPAAP